MSDWSSDVCSSDLTVALLDQLAVDLDVLERHPLEDRDRGCPANDLVDSRVRTVRLVVLPLLGVVEEGVHAVRDGVAGGLVASNCQEDDEEAELVVAQGLTVDIRDRKSTRLKSSH